MNLRVRDNLLYGIHRALSAAGVIRAVSLEEIRREGFRNVLVVATTAIGDAVLCTPLLNSLRVANPSARIGFWVSAAAVPLFAEQRGIDEIIPYHGKYRCVRATMNRLKTGEYDLALVANANDPDVIPMIWWSGCRRMIRRPQRYTIYGFMVANPEMLRRSHTSGHAIERNLQFCDLIGIPRGEARTRLEIAQDQREKSALRLKGCAGPWWVMHPGASRSKKQWGVDRYAELARRMLQNGSGTLILTGNASERKACDAIQRSLGQEQRIKNFSGELALNEFCALLAQVHLMVSGDTGPYHIAMAVNTPTVTLFAPWDIGSSPEINGPFFDKDRHLIVSTTTLGDDIKTLSVDRVWTVIQPFLEERGAAR